MRKISSTTAKGASLVEILVVTSMVGIFSAIVLPSMAKMVYAQRCSGLIFSFIGSLKIARSEAIKRNARVVLCKSSDGDSCVSAGGWEQGWIIFQDANNNGQREAGEEVIAQRGATDGLRFAGNRSVASYISYSPIGRARLVSSEGFQAGTITLCAPVHWGVDVREVVLSPAGSVRTAKGSQASCN